MKFFRFLPALLALGLLALDFSPSALGQTPNFVPGGDTDISSFKGSETDPAVAVDPNHFTNVCAAGVSSTTNGLFIAYITNFSSTSASPWPNYIGASGTNYNAAKGSTNLVPAYGEPSVAWDINSNLFLAYLPYNAQGSVQGVAIAVSTNAGKTFFALTNLVTNDVTDQPRIVAGIAGTNVGTNAASIWLVYKDYSLIGSPLVAQGLITTNIGTNGISAFTAQELIPGSANGGFPDIAVGPSNQAIVAFQDGLESSGPSSIYVSINTNTILTNGFGPSAIISSDAVGGSAYIPAASSADGINAGVGLAWDVNPGSLYYGRAYMVYTVETSSSTSFIASRYSVNNGSTWSAEMPVNHDGTNNCSHFFPRLALDRTTGSLAVCWCDCRNDLGAGSSLTIGPIITASATNYFTNEFDLDGISNDDYMIYGNASLSGGTAFSPDLPMIPIWTMGMLAASNLPAGGTFIYASEAALATNGNGIGHHIGLAYEAGNIYPVWPDNSDANAFNPLFHGSNPGPSGAFDFVTCFAQVATAAMAVSVTESPYPPTSAEALDYYIVLTNYGPFTATGIVITNQLSANLSIVPPQTTAAPGGQRFITNQTVYFDYPSLGPNQAITNHIHVTPQTGFATNAVGVSSSLPNTLTLNPYSPYITNSTYVTPSGDTFVTNIVLVNGEDLALSLTASPTNVLIGNPVTYSMVVSNLGPAANGLVYVTNTLSANLATVTNVVLSQGTYTVSNNVILFSLGTLASNGTATISYNATTLSITNSTNATNFAVVGGTDYDPDLTNNIVTNVVTIEGEDLGVTLSSSSTNVDIGDIITFTLDVINYGPSYSGNVTLSGSITTNLGNITVTSAQLPPSVTELTFGNTISGNLGQMSNGEDIQIQYTAVAKSLGTNFQIATNIINVTSTDFDQDMTNNHVTNILTINGEDLAAGVSAYPVADPTNLVLTYTDYVTNFGPSTTGVISVTNTLSSNLTSITVLQSPGPYSINGNTLIFHPGTLGLNQVATMVYTALPASLGTATNNMKIGSTDFDTNLVNNTNQVLTPIIPLPTLVSNFSVTAYASSAFLSWTTPYPATAQVAYWLTNGAVNYSSVSGPSTNHVVLLAGLARDTNYYFSAMTWELGNYFATNGSFATVDTIILNTQDASYSSFWTQGAQSTPDIYGSYFNVAGTTQGNATATATYTPNMPYPGAFNVYAWYPQSTNFSAGAVYVVTGETNALVDTINQTINGGTWRSLATNMFFDTGTGGNVALYNDTGESNKVIAANAMKWSYLTNQDFTPGSVPPWWYEYYFGTNSGTNSLYYSDFVFGLSPTDPTSVLTFWATPLASNQVMASFYPVMGGRIYHLQTATNLLKSKWVTLTNAYSISTNATGVFTNGTGYGMFTITESNAAQSYYRLSAQLGTNY